MPFAEVAKEESKTENAEEKAKSMRKQHIKEPIPESGFDIYREIIQAYREGDPNTIFPVRFPKYEILTSL